MHECMWVQFHWHWDRKHVTSIRTKFIHRQSDNQEIDIRSRYHTNTHTWLCHRNHAQRFKVEHRGARFSCSYASVYVWCLVEDSDEWLWYFCGSHALNRSQLCFYNGVAPSLLCFVWFDFICFFAMVQSVLNTMVPNEDSSPVSKLV